MKYWIDMKMDLHTNMSKVKRIIWEYWIKPWGAPI